MLEDAYIINYEFSERYHRLVEATINAEHAAIINEDANLLNEANNAFFASLAKLWRNMVKWVKEMWNKFLGLFRKKVIETTKLEKKVEAKEIEKKKESSNSNSKNDSPIKPIDIIASQPKITLDKFFAIPKISPFMAERKHYNVINKAYKGINDILRNINAQQKINGEFIYGPLKSEDFREKFINDIFEGIFNDPFFKRGEFLSTFISNIYDNTINNEKNEVFALHLKKDCQEYLKKVKNHSVEQKAFKDCINLYEKVADFYDDLSKGANSDIIQKKYTGIMKNDKLDKNIYDYDSDLEVKKYSGFDTNNKNNSKDYSKLSNMFKEVATKLNKVLGILAKADIEVLTLVHTTLTKLTELK